ncbi:MAG: type II toxin-antitoxin system Phd/YefM family antitoxin [Neisseria sp.]|nr:type II toxin-antitoxin system Phd/YefM family antitoxin [Neisseria sp.]
MNPILARYTVSVTELKRNFSHIMAQSDGAVAILNHNKPEAYLLTAAHYQSLMEYLEDLEDAKIILERAAEKAEKVSLDEL